MTPTHILVPIEEFYNTPVEEVYTFVHNSPKVDLSATGIKELSEAKFDSELYPPEKDSHRFSHAEAYAQALYDLKHTKP